MRYLLPTLLAGVLTVCAWGRAPAQGPALPAEGPPRPPAEVDLHPAPAPPTGPPRQGHDSAPEFVAAQDKDLEKLQKQVELQQKQIQVLQQMVELLAKQL